MLLTPAPTRDVPFTAGRALGVGATVDLGSPALSASVFLFGSGSLLTALSVSSIIPQLSLLYVLQIERTYTTKFML